MRKQTSSIDGFIPRRAERSLLSGSGSNRSASFSTQPITSAPAPLAEPGPQPIGLSRQELDDSLKGIEDEAPSKPKKRGLFRRRRDKQPRTRKQKIIRRLIILFVITLLAIGGFVAFRLWMASNNALQGNFLGLLQNQPLKMDANGRSNIVVFGTSEDDPGHEGALLTDSIMLVSVDQNKKNAYLLSIPRDLWVDYGQACNSGYAGRINEVYSCFSGDGDKEEAGSEALMKKVGDVTGLDTQYYVHMNYSVLRDAVDAVGGVSVVIDSDDPRGIYDNNFDWKCQYKCTYVKYPNGPTGLMDGEHALALARARGASGVTYGLAGANFDREKYQRKILIALKDRAASVGTLTNVGKVTGLIDAMGNNMRTSFDTAEIRTLMSLGTDIPSKSIKSLELNDKEAPLVGGTMINGASVLIPTAGQGNFSEIQAYIRKKISNNPIVREEAKVVVLNGTTTPGLAQDESDTLMDKGYTVTSTGNAPTTDYKDTIIYRLNKKDTTETAKALAKRYGVTISDEDPGMTVATEADFIVVIGASRVSSSGN